jgi:uncharacterized membrane protein YbhN (UPF0104 family)
MSGPLLTIAEAHAVCAALVATDVVARAWRIQLILAGLGVKARFGDAVTLNSFGDAASALTPLRFGGEPARLGGMLRAGVPAPAAFVAIALEVMASWPVVLAVAVPVALRHAPDWWASAAPALARAARGAWHWVAAIVVASLAAWVVARRVARPARRLRRPLRRAAVYWRRMPIGHLLLTAPLTLANLAARTGILVVLALTLPNPPAIGPLLVGSFALLYAQLVLPTPSGAGAVDFSFLGGAAGHLGPRDAMLLVAWRFYTNGVGILLGGLLALRAYGWPALRAAVTRGEAPSPRA